jgi:hypothetical protein
MLLHMPHATCSLPLRSASRGMECTVSHTLQYGMHCHGLCEQEITVCICVTHCDVTECTVTGPVSTRSPLVHSTGLADDLQPAVTHLHLRVAASFCTSCCYDCGVIKGHKREWIVCCQLVGSRNRWCPLLLRRPKASDQVPGQPVLP